MTSQTRGAAGERVASPADHKHHHSSTIQGAAEQVAPIGFLPGTLLLTRQGDRPVEAIQPGDDIISRDFGLVKCHAVDQRICTARAIWFAAGSLGDTRPECAVTLPADQQVLLRDWRAKAMFGQTQALVRAAALVDGEYIRDLGQFEMELTVLRFNLPLVIYASGLEVAGAPPSRAAMRSSASPLN
ncbi:Hint domain-containing protein [Pseudophaeobacter sp.]|uniref:Hint domain-containing protein n=1 Tax=Pseudophaeobacter sp. TaxID=1971739 RepID=UPI003299C1D2